MQRVLDIDLDFFVHEPAHWPDQTRRLDPGEHPAWEIEQALEFLRDRCLLSEPLPGFVTENHGELFPRWRAAVDAGILIPPFSVTHVDAHADLGLGDAGYVYLITELMHLPPEQRAHPKPGPGRTGLTDGNHLAYAVACRWISDLTYVYCAGGGNDELYFVMEGLDRNADHLQVPVLTAQQVEWARNARHNSEFVLPQPQSEPRVPYQSIPADSFQSDAPFDFVCLTRSPPYTPPTADPLYDAIRSTFMRDEF